MKEDCLDRLIPLCGRHLPRALAEFGTPLTQRNHQGLANDLIRMPTTISASGGSPAPAPGELVNFYLAGAAGGPEFSRLISNTGAQAMNAIAKHCREDLAGAQRSRVEFGIGERSGAFQNSTWSRNSRRIVPTRRSTNGCDRGNEARPAVVAAPGSREPERDVGS